MVIDCPRKKNKSWTVFSNLATLTRLLLFPEYSSRVVDNYVNSLTRGGGGRLNKKNPFKPLLHIIIMMTLHLLLASRFSQLCKWAKYELRLCNNR
jgi:hypothetical protein